MLNLKKTSQLDSSLNSKEKNTTTFDKIFNNIHAHSSNTKFNSHKKIIDKVDKVNRSFFKIQSTLANTIHGSNPENN